MLLDNGRTRALADEVGRQALRCIRCSACLNVCPVYERVGGHAYGSVYPGPIGAILNPLLQAASGTDEQTDSLPYASSLCGACFEVCPVRIDIPSVLVDLRAQVVDSHRGDRCPSAEALAMRAAAAFALSRRRRQSCASAGRLSPALRRCRRSRRRRSRRRAAGPAPATSRPPPEESFRAWWDRTDGGPWLRRGAATSMSARDEILGRVRAALDASRPGRGARRRRGRPGADLVGLFVERVEDYRAVVDRCAPAELAAVVAACSTARASSYPPAFGSTCRAPVVDDRLTAAELDDFDAVVTRARVGIAETGTIVLDHRPGQGRRAISLVPDLHVCIVAPTRSSPTSPTRSRCSTPRGRSPGSAGPRPPATSSSTGSRACTARARCTSSWWAEGQTRSLLRHFRHFLGNASAEK